MKTNYSNRWGLIFPIRGILLLVLLFINACGRNEDVSSNWLDSKESLYPLAVGNRWVYERTGAEGARDTLEMRVVGQINIGGQRFSRVMYHHPGVNNMHLLSRKTNGEIWGLPRMGTDVDQRYLDSIYHNQYALYYPCSDSLGRKWKRTDSAPYTAGSFVETELVSIGDTIMLRDTILTNCFRLFVQGGNFSYEVWYKEGWGIIQQKFPKAKYKLIFKDIR